MRELGLEKGWGWTRLIAFAEFQNFIGVAMLAGLTIVGYAAILPVFISRKDVTYAVMVGAEIVLLLLAASGLLTAGH
jgi:hypothetical protein